MTIIRKKIPKNTYDKFDMMWLKSVKISNGLEQRKLWKQKFWKFGKLEIPKLKIKSSLVVNSNLVEKLTLDPDISSVCLA